MRIQIVPKEPIAFLEEDGCIAHEQNLPFPYVHYPSGFSGAFFGFQKEEKGSVFHCSCQKKGLEVYLKNQQGFWLSEIPKTSRVSLVDTFVNSLQFKDFLCHICNRVCPQYGYGKEWGKTKFHSIYGFYVNAQMYGYGIDPMGEVYEPELIPTDIVPYLVTKEYNDIRLDDQSLKDFQRYCENITRTRTGYYTVGNKWTTEIKLLEIVKKLYPSYSVIHQYELDYLYGDIFIEELNLVIEYQGQQHFEPTPFMGGEAGLVKRKQKDKEKVEICNHYNLGIMYFSYQDDLTEELVKKRIASYLLNMR